MRTKRARHDVLSAADWSNASFDGQKAQALSSSGPPSPQVWEALSKLALRMYTHAMIRSLAGLLIAAIAAWAPAFQTELEIGNNRSQESISRAMDERIRSISRNLAALSAAHRDALDRAGLYDRRVQFSIPSRLVLTRNGRRLGESPLIPDFGGTITLEFDTSGPRAFPSSYRQLLIDTFTMAKPALEAVWGAPNVGGVVKVRNYDADIGDRDAVAGGYFVPDNGNGEAEIRFPIYLLNETAAVNFVHCLLLAYQGPTSYGFDAYQEGLARAATMRIVRTANSLPASLDPGLVESVLDNTYDVGTFYDWYNQRALGGNKFIAPNLRDVPLPIGGSLGGVYLLRYQMAGSAWQKVLVEYPGFAATLNDLLYSNPGWSGNVANLMAAGQTVLDTLGGAPNSTIESYSFAEWVRRQFILEARDTMGLKLVCHPIPLPPDAGTSDFGVFDLPVTYFETLAGGNEVLLSGTSYPIFWNELFQRFFAASQDERIDIAGAYGNVAPNFPNFGGGTPYRVSVDIPVQDRISRVYLPAGAIATGANPSPKNFYGTIVGATNQGTLKVRLTYGVTVVDNIPVNNFAFGTSIGGPQFNGPNRCRIEVIQTINSVSTTIIDRRVNKGPGPLGVDLRPNYGDALQVFSPSIPKGLSTIGFSADPYSSSAPELLGVPSGELLAARWNGAKAKYDLFPDFGAFVQGGGYFVRMPAAAPNVPIVGRSHSGEPVAVSLRPGWNLISNPLPQTVQTSDITVAHAADTPTTWAGAIGEEIGPAFFEFTPGANDPATGAPETGTMNVATQFVPGRAYFVRCLASAGATLLFGKPGPQRPAGQATAPPRFVMRVKLASGRDAAEVQFGQSASATIGFDPREDWELPPGTFGLQGKVEGSSLFRDMRPSGNAATFVVRFDGMKPLTTYRIEFKPVSGAIYAYSIRRVGESVWRRVRGTISLPLRITSDFCRYEIKVEAGS